MSAPDERDSVGPDSLLAACDAYVYTHEKCGVCAACIAREQWAAERERYAKLEAHCAGVSTDLAIAKNGLAKLEAEVLKLRHKVREGAVARLEMIERMRERSSD